MWFKKKAGARRLRSVFTAFLVGLVAGCFFSTYVTVKARAHAGFFTMAGFPELDFFSGGHTADHGRS